MQNIILVTSLCHEYQDRLIISNFSMSLEKGEAVALVGPSGKGKTTILHIIAELLEPTSGSIFRKNKKTSMVFQDFLLFPHMNCLENCILSTSGTPEVLSKVKSLAEFLEVDDCLMKMPEKISHGQKQRIAIIRSLAINPDFLLLDEPTSALDKNLVKKLIVLLKKYKNMGTSLLFASHDSNFISEIADRSIVIQ